MGKTRRWNRRGRADQWHCSLCALCHWHSEHRLQRQPDLTSSSASHHLPFSLPECQDWFSFHLAHTQNPAVRLPQHASRQIGLHCTEEVMINRLLLINHSIRSQRPPFRGGEVGRHFSFRPTTPIPLNQMEIVRLCKPYRQINQFGIFCHLGHAIDLIHELQNMSLCLVAQEEFHSATTSPSSWIDR